jgi:hypothetical protein
MNLSPIPAKKHLLSENSVASNDRREWARDKVYNFRLCFPLLFLKGIFLGAKTAL